MKAKKENKVYCITTEQEKQRYLKAGYDIYADDGELLEYSPQKKISYSQYAALQKENDLLKQERLALRSENSNLQSENESLRSANSTLQSETEALRLENVTLRESAEIISTVNAVMDRPETGQAEKKDTKASGKKAGG